MDVYNGQCPVPAKAIQTPAPKPMFGNQAAKFSIMAAVVSIALNLTADIFLKEQQVIRTMVSAGAISACFAGLLGAITGLIITISSRKKDMGILAAAGLLMNGGIFVMNFDNMNVSGRHVPVIEKTAAKGIGIRSVSVKSGRTIETKDWSGGYVIELADYNFDSVVEGSDMPVLVDFWAPWCGPCRRMSPIIEQLAQEYEGKAKICKLNVDNAGETSRRFKVRGIPTIILFEKGRIRKKWMGTTNRAAICLEINKLID